MSSERKMKKEIKKNSRISWIIGVIVLLIIVVIFASIYVNSDPQRKYNRQIAIAERYLENQNYEQAIAAYLAAIDIDPKDPEAYKSLAELYIEIGDLESAKNILEEGIASTENGGLKRSLTEVEERLLREQQVADAERNEETKQAQEIEGPDAADSLSEESGSVEEIPEVVGETNWRGGEWINRDDVMPSMNNEGYIVFGAYEQDGNERNGPEPIEWEVVENNANGTLLLSRYVLDCQSYNKEDTKVSWEACTLRKWLNEDFWNNAFTANEKNLVRITTISNPGHSSWSDGESDTQDRVFCLNEDEILEYYEFNDWSEFEQYGFCYQLITKPTVYAQKNEVNTTILKEEYEGWLERRNYDAEVIGHEASRWWLRSPGGEYSYACFVDCDGKTGWKELYYVADYTGGVRPAIYIEQ